MRDAARLLVCAAIVGGACGGGHPPARGLGSRQVVADRSVTQPRFSQDLTRVFFGRVQAGISPDNFPPTDLFSLDVASGEETPIATQVSYYFEGIGPAGRLRPLFLYSQELGPSGVATGLNTLTIVEPDTGDRTVIDHISDVFACCDSTVKPMAMFRGGPPIGSPHPGVAFGNLWLGTYKQLHQVTPDLLVSDFALPEEKGVLVLAANKGLLTQLAFGVFRVGYDGAVIETVLAPDLTKYEQLPGQAPLIPLQSSSIDASTFLEEGCIQATALGPAATSPRCFVTYRRVVQSQVTLRFLHFLDEDRELVVPHSARPFGDLTFDVLGNSVRHSELFTWVGENDPNPNPSLWTWNLVTGDVSGCELPGSTNGTLAWRPDGDAFALLADQQDVNPFDASRSGDVVVKALGDGTCATLPGHMLSFDFAPQGLGMISLSRSSSGDATTDLAVQGAPGMTPRALASATSFWSTRFLDENRVLLWRFATEGLGLSWLDTTLAAPVEHPVAEQLMRDPIRLGGGRLLVAHDFATQDETATLSLFDLDADSATLVSRSVSDFATPFFVPPAAPIPTTDVPIAYVVKGRNPSGQDGIWLASVPSGSAP